MRNRTNPHTRRLVERLAHAVRAPSCVLDGEIVCLAPDGRSLFHRLLFRRDWPHFIAFDVLSIDGEDMRDRPLLQRKRRLRGIMPRIDSRLVYMDHVLGRGSVPRRPYACSGWRPAVGIRAVNVKGFRDTAGRFSAR